MNEEKIWHSLSTILSAMPVDNLGLLCLDFGIIYDEELDKIEVPLETVN